MVEVPPTALQPLHIMSKLEREVRTSAVGHGTGVMAVQVTHPGLLLWALSVLAGLSIVDLLSLVRQHHFEPWVCCCCLNIIQIQWCQWLTTKTESFIMLDGRYQFDSIRVSVHMSWIGAWVE